MSFVQLNIADLSIEAIEGLLEEFVTRDGTDYGKEERSLEQKKEALRLQLERGDVVIVFDNELQSSNIVRKEILLS